jgi:Fe-S-cluster containining protein
MVAPQLPRQQRRKIKRDSIERGRKVLARGLGADLAEDEALGVALILHDCLGDATRAGRAAHAAEIVETLLEKSLAADVKGIELGCRKGCSYCCSALVTCSAPEIFRVADWLRANARGAAAAINLDAIKAEAARRDGLPIEKRFTERAPCPLLIEGACGVYPVRPIPCRALYSLSSEACRMAMHEDKGEVPIITAAMSKGEMARTLLLAAVSASGFSDRGIELTAGVMAVIDKPDAQARWLAGENVFEGVLGGERTPSARQSQEHIAKLVRAVVD